jgi:peptidoglycan-associated lipoprotein
MKRYSLFPLAVITVALALASAGCKTHRTMNTTDIPGMSTPSSQSPGNGLSQGGQVAAPDTTTKATSEGLESNADSKWAKIWNGPHDEDRDTFKADTVYFDFDSSTIKPSEEQKLQQVAAHFKSDEKNALQVEGNCDERGTEKYNLSLGERRALAIREYLANLGMDAQRIRTVTYGASRPAEQGHNEEAFKKNRRGEFVLLIPK